jgi:tetratricopeptide (TPR) repeat protein
MFQRSIMGLCLAGSLACAGEKSAALLAAGIREFASASQAWDGAGFAKAADLFGQASAQEPESGLNCYWKGVAEFHQVLQLFGATNAPSRGELAKAIDAAIETLTRAVALNERDAESHALLANVYGLSIAARPVRAAWLGPRVLKHQKSALRCGPANPRVQYLIGTSQYHGPASLGGKREALQHFLQAEELFAEEAGRPAEPLEPRWGRSSCLAFIGKTYGALGKPVDAERYFLKALQVNPLDPLAREELEKRKR